jgi:hypothetical protein
MIVSELIRGGEQDRCNVRKKGATLTRSASIAG